MELKVGLYHEMIKLFPDRNLLIISDENGCDHYKHLAQKKGLNLFKRIDLTRILEVITMEKMI